jgi:hypothetical protein
MCLAIRQRFFADVLRDDDPVDEVRLDDVRLRVPADLRDPEDLRDPDDFRDPEDLRDGTLPPLLRASLSPMAMACLRLLTLRPELLLSVPRLRRRIVDSTFLEADLPYFAMRETSSARGACKCMTHDQRRPRVAV